MKRLNIGYIGWLFHDDTEYCRAYAVCDVNQSKLNEYSSRHPEVKVYTDYRAMVEDPALDVVIISTPNWLHCEMTELFLSKGVHVFCEKPMGVNRNELDRMLTAQKKSGKNLSIDFEMRASGGTKRIKEIIDSGELGTVKGVEFTHHRGAWLNEGAMLWRTKPEKSGGYFFMEPCHEVDYFRFTMGEITHVQSFKFPNTMPQYGANMPDNVCTHLFFENGAHGIILATHALSVFTAKHEEYADKGHDMNFVYYGDKGALRYNCITNDILVVRQDEYPVGSGGSRVEFGRIEKGSEEMSHHDITACRMQFIEACAKGTVPLQDAYDAWRSHRVCLAAEQSALNGFAKIEVDYSL